MARGATISRQGAHYGRRSSALAPVIVLFAILLKTSMVFPAVYTWDIAAGGGINPGSGTWGTNNYWTTDGGTTIGAWPGWGNSAIFGGSDGTYTITINGTQYADSIAFQKTLYTLSGGYFKGIVEVTFIDAFP